MKQFTVLVGFGDGEGGLFVCDAIRYKNQLWLVPEWLEAPEAGLTRPKRLILMETLKHQKANGMEYDYVLNDPLPTVLFADHIPPELKKTYTVIDEPDVVLKTPKGSGTLQ